MELFRIACLGSMERALSEGFPDSITVSPHPQSSSVVVMECVVTDGPDNPNGLDIVVVVNALMWITERSDDTATRVRAFIVQQINCC